MQYPIYICGEIDRFCCVKERVAFTVNFDRNGFRTKKEYFPVVCLRCIGAVSLYNLEETVSHERVFTEYEGVGDHLGPYPRQQGPR